MKFIDFIIAEDIRFETGNKVSVMGVYNEVIGLNLQGDINWPIPFRFGVFVRLDTEDCHDIPSKFVLTVDHDDKNIARVEGNLDIKKTTNTIALPLVLSPFPLPGYGEIQFNFEIYSDRKLLNKRTQNLKIQSLEGEK